MSDKNIFTEIEGKFDNDESFRPTGRDYFNPEEFEKLVQARRSVRKFSDEIISDEIFDKIMDLTLLAPNSSNLQTWEFIRVKNKEIKSKLAEACFSQSAARTASDLIVCIADASKAVDHCKLTLEEMKKLNTDIPKAAEIYYSKLAPMVYNPGPLGLYSPFKWFFFNLLGLFKVVPRGPFFKSDLNTWAQKSCALACENMMLAYRAFGYDTCPMEGFDELKVRKILNLKCSQKVVMIIGAGKASNGGIYGPQMRFDKKLFVKTLN